MDTAKIVDVLNEILEHEIAGVVRYTHYSFMVFGHNRIPIVSWLREQANESLGHATEVGELVTRFGGHPSLKIGKLLETHQHTIQNILQESLEHEKAQVKFYEKLLEVVQNKSISLEEFARTKIAEEEDHISQVEKMLKSPGPATV
jgi:bacterioferritin